MRPSSLSSDGDGRTSVRKAQQFLSYAYPLKGPWPYHTTKKIRTIAHLATIQELTENK